MKIKCTAIVHFNDGVVLVRDKDSGLWRLPERELDETQDVLTCIRRCVVAQTGYRTKTLRFFKIQSLPKTTKQGALLHFIFGSEVSQTPLQQAELDTQHFTPNEIMLLAARNKFTDPFLLNLLHMYNEMIPPPLDPSPFDP